jgi:hypothetical protein
MPAVKPQSGGLEVDVREKRVVEVPPTRVFCQKSVDLLDYKGVDFFGVDKEFVTI